MSRRLLLVALLSLPCVACDETVEPPDAGPDSGPVDSGPVDSGPVDAGPGEDLLRDDCEALNPEFCAMPFPSDYWLADDATTASGHRVALGATTLPRSNVRMRNHVDPTPFNERDGWSVNGSILAYLPGATVTGMARPDSIERSLEDASLTVLINAETGERVPHFSEIDESVQTDDAPQAIIVRPVVVLEHATRYIVALRGLVDESGATLPAPETFAALRDDTASEVPSVEARRAHFEALFTTLDTHGVDRADLQLAWDFTTASLEDDTQWMLSVRDQALAVVGADGPSFRFEPDCPAEDAPARCSRNFTVEENAHIRRRLYGSMTVPLYMTSADEGSLLNLGADGMPVQNGTAEYPFVINIPRSASADNPMHPIQYGHGLLGAHNQANAGWLAEFGNTHGYMPFGVDWIGMSESDVVPITLALANGTLAEFRTIPERLCQGIVNSLLAMRMMLGAVAAHPEMMDGDRSIIDTSAGFYTGDSQGGIFGATYMAITTDVERGILGVPGQPYNLLLNRSVDFDPYLSLLQRAFDDGVNIQLALVIIQQLWDRAEPGSYSSHIMNDPLPGTPSHQVILQPAIGDHQVTTLGAHIMARAIGAVAIRPVFRPIWGIEEVDGPHVGSAIVEFDFGLTEPLENVPVREGEDPHGDVRKNPRALEQTRHFFETGEIIHTCDGPCDPE